MLLFRKWWKRSRNGYKQGEYYRPGCEQLGSGSRKRLPGRTAIAYAPRLEALEQRLVLDFATGAISAVATAGNDTVYALAPDPGTSGPGANVWRHDNSGWQQLSTGNLYKTLSAGIDIGGAPMVFALDTNNVVSENSGNGFVTLNNSVPFTQITGGVNHIVFALDASGTIWRHNIANWKALTGPIGALQISAGTMTVNGGLHNVLFGVGPDHNPYVNLDPEDKPSSQHFQRLDGSGLTQSVRGGTEPSVFAITTDGSVFKGTAGGFQRIYSSANGPADNVGVLTTNGVDSALITNSNEDLILAGAGGSSVISGNFNIVGEVAGDSKGTIYVAAEISPSTEASDLWFQSSGANFAQLTSGGLLFDPDDANVY